MRMTVGLCTQGDSDVISSYYIQLFSRHDVRNVSYGDITLIV